MNHCTPRRSRFLVFGSALIVACAQVDPEPDYQRARRLIEESTGRADVYDPYAAPLHDQEIETFLADGLSLEEALDLALRNNRKLQADFQEIGLAHTDWVQAKLLSNPSLEFLLRFPTGGGSSLLEAALGLEILELWRVPVREEAARLKLEAAVLNIARQAGLLLADTRRAYYSAVAAEQTHQIAVQREQFAERSYEAIRELRRGGAADALEENLAHGPYLSAKLAREAALLKVRELKGELAQLLSVPRSLENLLLLDELPESIPAEWDSDPLVELALQSRLDLQAIRSAVEELSEYVRLEDRQAWGELQAGPNLERTADGKEEWVGATFDFTLPIFDQNQAQVSRAQFKLLQAQKLQESAQVSVSQEVRIAVERVRAAAESLRFYRSEYLPQAEAGLFLVEEAYSLGNVTLISLLDVEKRLLNARHDFVTVQLEATLALSELQLLIGTPLEEL